MPAESSEVPLLSREKLRDILKRASAEQWQELALIGNNYDRNSSILIRDGWSPDHVFVLPYSLHSQDVVALATLTSLTRLNLIGNVFTNPHPERIG